MKENDVSRQSWHQSEHSKAFSEDLKCWWRFNQFTWASEVLKFKRSLPEAWSVELSQLVTNLLSFKSLAPTHIPAGWIDTSLNTSPSISEYACPQSFCQDCGAIDATITHTATPCPTGPGNSDIMYHSGGPSLHPHRPVDIPLRLTMTDSVYGLAHQLGVPWNLRYPRPSWWLF